MTHRDVSSDFRVNIFVIALDKPEKEILKTG